MIATPAASAHAYDRYLRALHLLDQVDNPQRFDLAADLLEGALELDPNFAAARAHLSFALAGQYKKEQEPQLLRRAEEEVRRALADATRGRRTTRWRAS